MPARPIGDLLAATEELKALRGRTRRIRKLQSVYFEAAPRALATASRVKNFKAGTLFVAADNAAVAAKLRQLAPTVLASIRKTDGEVTGLRIEVQVRGMAAPARGRGVNPLGPEAVRQFDVLADTVSSRRLRAALKKLVRHQRSRG